MTETLREAIQQSGLTIYAIAKATGLQTDSLYRFVGGRTSLRLDLADRLAEFLGLELCRKVEKAANGKGKSYGKRSQ